MFEARLQQGSVIKKIVEAIKELVEEANFDCSENGIALQAMDASHVALVSMLLRPSGFEPYRCDRTRTLGIQVANMHKIIKCGDNNDTITLSAQDDGDSLNFTFESQNQEKMSSFQMKLMDIDTDTMSIPEKEYDAVVTMSSAEFQRTCRDLSMLGEVVKISVTKEGVTFSASGDVGKASIKLSQGAGDVDGKDTGLSVEMNTAVELSFALNYLNQFCKATALSSTVTLSLSGDTPLVVEYRVGDMGYIRYYLAFKIDEEDDDDDGVKQEE